MSMLQLPIEDASKDEASRRKQIVMIVKNVDPLHPDVQFFPPQSVRDGANPFDVDLGTVTGGKEEEVSVRVLLLQDGVTFMSGEEDVTAGCDVSQKYLRRVSPCSTKPAKEVEFLVNPLSKDGPVLLFNLGLIASGTAIDSNGEAADWTVPIVIDPKIRNMS
jgi:hypothetical protein